MSAFRLPSMPRAPRLPGQPPLPRGAKVAPRRRPDASRGQPPDWQWSNLEWVVMQYFLNRKWRVATPWRHRYPPDPEVYHQIDLPLPINVRRLTKGDFLVVKGPNRRGGDWGPERWLVLDPIPPGTFIHGNPTRDRLKRRVLAEEGYRVVFVEGARLLIEPVGILDLALRGVDQSRYRGGA